MYFFISRAANCSCVRLLFHVRAWCESCCSRVNTCVRGRVFASAQIAHEIRPLEKKKRKVSCPCSPSWTSIHYLSPSIRFNPTGVSVLNDTGPWQLATDAGDESEDQKSAYTHKHTYTCVAVYVSQRPSSPTSSAAARGSESDAAVAVVRWKLGEFLLLSKEIGLKFWRRVGL